MTQYSKRFLPSTLEEIEFIDPKKRWREDVFTKDEVAKRSYEKAEKFRRDQAAQLRYAEEEGRKEGRAESLTKAVAMLKKLKISKDLATAQIVETYALSSEEAAALVNSCW